MKSTFFIAGLALLLSSAPAFAVLGGAAETPASDSLKLHVQLATSEHSAFTIHTSTTSDGVTVNEYVSGSTGEVFALSWNGPWRPDLQHLLGTYYARYQTEMQSNRQAKGRAPLSVQKDDIVIQNSGHARAFSGIAYLPTELPAGVSTADLK